MYLGTSLRVERALLSITENDVASSLDYSEFVTEVCSQEG